MKKQTTQWGNNQTKFKHGTFYKTTGLDSSKDSTMVRKKRKDSWGAEIKRDSGDMVIKCNMWTYPCSAKSAIKIYGPNGRFVYDLDVRWHWGIKVIFSDNDNGILTM